MILGPTTLQRRDQLEEANGSRSRNYLGLVSGRLYATHSSRVSLLPGGGRWRRGKSNQLECRDTRGRRHVDLASAVRQSSEMSRLPWQLSDKPLCAGGRVQREYVAAEIDVPDSPRGDDRRADGRLAALIRTAPGQRKPRRAAADLQ